MPKPTKSDDLGIDWQELRARYDAGESLRSIAKDVGLSHTALNKRARSEGWKPSAEAWKPLAKQTDTARRITAPITQGDKEIAALGIRTPDNQAKILAGIETGMAIERSAGLVGMSPSGLRKWIREDPDFQRLVERAAYKKEHRRLKKIEDSQAWQASSWLLSHDPDSREAYGEHRQSGAGLQVTVNLHGDAKPMKVINAD